MELTLHIHSLEEKLFSGKISYVQIPGKQGRFEVRWNHAPLITTLVPGELIYGNKQGKALRTKVKGGLVQVENNIINIWL